MSHTSQGNTEDNTGILIIDIETYPNYVSTYDIGRRLYLSYKNIEKPAGILSFAYKWLKASNDNNDCDNDVEFVSLISPGPGPGKSSSASRAKKRFFKRLHDVLSKADVVCGWNVRRFDVPFCNSAMLESGLTPPSGYKIFDLYEIYKRAFYTQSGHLGYVGKVFGVGSKVELEKSMIDLSKLCLKGDSEALELLKKYNVQDVKLAEHLYMKFIGVVKPPINLSAKLGVPCCPACASNKYRAIGWHYAVVYRYKKYMCSNCGSIFRQNTREDCTNPTRMIPLGFG